MRQIDLDHGARLIQPHIGAAFRALPSQSGYLTAQQTAKVVKHHIFRPEEKFCAAIQTIGDASEHRRPKTRAAIRNLNRQPI